ncbi:aminoacyl-histidine dipeptidase [Peptoniphilus sp.]|jgi:dipeptidase D|uniref:aminoacyl-histidine dipeptidase n=1 Tax=Peptoniphilus sp. TaxID=1971214 RepID=UPI003D8E64FB
MRNIESLLEDRVFYYFDKITKIPRESFHEEKIRQFLIDFAKEHNLEFYTDKIGNVIIKKEATEGYAESDSIILQGHMDMVCEKDEESNIDFSNDPIEYKIEGDRIVAEHTTLGADNGIAVAMILAILESDEYKHPKIEALFTVNEENGMTGAKNLENKYLDSKMLLNIDSEDEGRGCVSCAGGQRDLITFKKEYKEIDESLDFYDLIVSGLKGGHSGQEIHKGLGNSNKILARSLYRIFDKFDSELIQIEGGAKPNAIPRLAKAKIALSAEDKIELQKLIVEINGELVKELGKVDPDVRLNLEVSKEKTNRAFTDDLADRIIKLINILPDGVMSMSKNIEGLVESSVNVGVIIDGDEDVEIITNVRSQLSSLKDNIANMNKIAASLCGAEFEVQSDYPAWEYKENSKLRDIASNCYKEITGEELILEEIHAGLECGLFKETIGDIDMLSVGPDMDGVHAPGENLSISSTERVFKFVVKILEELK